ncbi:MAG TPA: hypothetical protein DDY31_06710 [Lachnospiraceae bacterium]|nr:hypothetical protein [Lachnospiraceae bacterium]
MLSFAKGKAIILSDRAAEKEYEAACAVFDSMDITSENAQEFLAAGGRVIECLMQTKEGKMMLKAEEKELEKERKRAEELMSGAPDIYKARIQYTARMLLDIVPLMFHGTEKEHRKAHNDFGLMYDNGIDIPFSSWEKHAPDVHKACEEAEENCNCMEFCEMGNAELEAALMETIKIIIDETTGLEELCAALYRLFWIYRQTMVNL